MREQYLIINLLLNILRNDWGRSLSEDGKIHR